MFRLALFGLLVVASPACSKSEGAGTAVVAGANAGTVIDLAGKVTATRDGKARDLKIGDAVSGDDVIATPADGKVAIELLHNNARWNLGGGKTTKVSESSAWSLAKADKVADVTTGDTSAAGRHAEKQAADTAASAESAPPPVAAAAAADPGVPSTGAPTAATRSRTPSPGAPSPGGPPMQKGSPPSPPVTAPRTRAEPPTAPLAQATESSRRSPAPPPPPPPADVQPKAADVGTAAEERKPELDVAKAPTTTTASHGSVAADATMKACVAKIAGASKITISCKANACTLGAVVNVTPEARACIVARLPKLGLTGTFDETITFTK